MSVKRPVQVGDFITSGLPETHMSFNGSFRIYQVHSIVGSKAYLVDKALFHKHKARMFKNPKVTYKYDMATIERDWYHCEKEHLRSLIESFKNYVVSCFGEIE